MCGRFFPFLCGRMHPRFQTKISAGKTLAAGWWVVCTSIKTEFPFLFKSLLSDQVATKALQSLFGNARLLQKGLKRLKRIHLYTSRVSIRSAFASVMFAMDMYISCGKVLNLFCSKS